MDGRRFRKEKKICGYGGGLHCRKHLYRSFFGLLKLNRNKTKQSLSTELSEIESETLILYLVNNSKALGVALGIVGLLGIMLVMYACLAWSPNEKRGYSFPPGQQKSGAIEENDPLFSTSSSMYYNRYVTVYKWSLLHRNICIEKQVQF